MFATLKSIWQTLTMKVNGETTALQSGGVPRAQQQSPVKLDIIVVGAGISGLATAISAALSGHNVTVFESAKELLEVRQAGDISISRARVSGVYASTRGIYNVVGYRSVLVFK